MELKEGMFVKFKNRRGCFWNTSGKMDKYMETIQIVKEVTSALGFTIVDGEYDV